MLGVATKRAGKLAIGTGIAMALLWTPSAGAATLTVTTTAFSNASSCTLNDAMSAANYNQDTGACTGTGTYGDDTINITATGTMTLPNPQHGLTVVNSNMVINGPGTGQLEIRRESGPNAFHIFEVESGTTASISDLTVSNGAVTQVGGAGGAGVFNFGTLTLDRVAVVDNHVNVQSASLNPAPSGGGIVNYGTLTLRRSTVQGNSVTATQTATTMQHSASASGGGIASYGPLTVERSTISGNTASASVLSSDATADASAFGGGLTAEDGTAVRQSTISGNRVAANADSSPNAAQQGRLFVRGGGILNEASLTLTSDTIASNGSESAAPLEAANLWAGGTEGATNTILADPVGASNCSGTVESSGGGNLVSPATSPADCGLATALGADPLLGPLQDNGGPTETRALPVTSPAVDAGANSGEASDQRELARPVDRPDVANSNGTAYDIGAFELQPDTDEPETTIDSVEVSTKKPKATFTFSSDEPDSTFRCRLDDGTYDDCTSPKTYKHLKHGRHRFRVFAVDASGNPDSSPASERFKIKR